jgi:uncharacterized protein YcbK (DUF882 family)
VLEADAVNITDHFNAEEFRSHDGVDYPAEWVDDRLRPLCALLEQVRALAGGPLAVISGYRSPAHNTAVGGAKLSQHMEGRAADVRPVTDGGSLAHACAELHARVLAAAQRGELPDLGGLGLYPGWIHVDIRPKPPSGHIAQWTGSGVGAEVA